jgi:hypothetical protein
VFVGLVDPGRGLLEHGVLPSHLLPLPQCQLLQVLYALPYLVEVIVEFDVPIAHHLELHLLIPREGRATGAGRPRPRTSSSSVCRVIWAAGSE